MNQGLLIGIDYTGEYCQACYFNYHHNRPESITAGTEMVRYLIPNAICYSPEEQDWLIGHAALEYSERTGAYLFEDLLANHFLGEVCHIDGREYSYAQLLALYLQRIIRKTELISGMQGVENLTITLRKTGMEVKEVLTEVFESIGISRERVRLLSSAESFAYYVMNENPELWKTGSVLFDFSGEGLFAKRLTVNQNPANQLIYVNEYNYSYEFSVRDLASEMMRPQLDRKLLQLYREVKGEDPISSIYFTGDGFDEKWFGTMLRSISQDARAFKGNNIFVKGACLAGYRRSVEGVPDYPIICKGRTKADISVEMRYRGEMIFADMSKAATDWYDAGVTTDFILDHVRSVTFYVTSLVSKERSAVEFDLSAFPERPNKTTRIRVDIRYPNEFECVITVKDMGFGEFFPASGLEVSKRLNLEEFI